MRQAKSETLLILVIALLSALSLMIICVDGSSQAQAQSSNRTSNILTVVLHNSQGQPLSGVTCEVLSYDWGLKMGQAYNVIAKGETDASGSVSFDDRVWPHSGYRFRFRATDHTKPADTYFLPENQNQYRGYPGAVVGGQSDTEYFAIASDGLPYNDLASGQGMPDIQKDPVGGLQQPRVTIMPSKDYFATARAQTATAYAGGAPIPATPAPPPTFSGITEPALSITPQAGATTAFTATTTINSNPINNGAVINPTPPRVGTPAAGQQSTIYVATKANQGENSTLIAAMLAIVGLISFFSFWHYRYAIYARLGIEIIAARPKPKRKGLLARLFRRRPGKAKVKTQLRIKAATNNADGKTARKDQN